MGCQHGWRSRDWLVVFLYGKNWVRIGRLVVVFFRFIYMTVFKYHISSMTHQTCKHDIHYYQHPYHQHHHRPRHHYHHHSYYDCDESDKRNQDQV